MLSLCSALSPKGAGILTSDRNKTNSSYQRQALFCLSSIIKIGMLLTNNVLAYLGISVFSQCDSSRGD